MKIICPTCDTNMEIGSQSRYAIFTCSCGRKFRGIYAEVNMVNVVANKFGSLFIPLYNAIVRPSVNWDETECPNCWSSIPLAENPQYQGFISPSSCWSCGCKLPTSIVKEFDAEKKAYHGY